MGVAYGPPAASGDTNSIDTTVLVLHNLSISTCGYTRLVCICISLLIEQTIISSVLQNSILAAVIVSIMVISGRSLDPLAFVLIDLRLTNLPLCTLFQ